MDQKPNELQKPAGASAPSGDEPVIHVIPEKFYGAALKKKIAKTPPPAAPPMPPGQVPAPQPAKKGGPLVAIIIVLVLLLLGGGGAAAYFILLKPAPKPVAVVNTAPPPPVCGDKKCQAPTETPQSCPADCGPPPPVCGDKKCEPPTETPQNCSVDCGPPPPVCGDSKCEAPETYESCPADCKPPEPTPGLDSDSDGLTNEEEINVFGTDPNNPDTDHDGYVDLNEVLNLFDPAKPQPALLKDNPHIATYSNAAQNYVVLRPAAWSVRESDATKKEVFFDAPSGEFVEILVQDKDKAQSIMDWYLAQAPGVTSSQVEPFKTKQGYDAVSSPDKSTTYVDGGDKVYVVSYNLGKRFEIQYKVTFQVIVASLKKLVP